MQYFLPRPVGKKLGRITAPECALAACRRIDEAILAQHCNQLLDFFSVIPVPIVVLADTDAQDAKAGQVLVVRSDVIGDIGHSDDCRVPQETDV